MIPDMPSSDAATCPACHEPIETPVCPKCGEKLPVAPRAGEEPRRETDHRGIELPARRLIGGIISPQ